MVYEQRKVLRKERIVSQLLVHSSIPVLRVVQNALVMLSDVKQGHPRVCKIPTNHHRTKKKVKVPQGGAK